MDEMNSQLSELASSLKSGWAYVWFIVLGIWGGTASYLSRMRKKGLPFSVAELVGEWVISAFSGVITALLCMDLGMSIELTAAMSGVAGHMGGRATYMFEQYIVSKFSKKSSDIPD